MYAFAVVVLLGLALFKVVDVLEDLLPGLTRYHSLATLILGVAGAFALDYSIFDSWKIGFRERWMAVAATGLIITGCTSVWRAAFHWLGSSEGDAPEVRHPMQRPRSMAA
ncbi:MAG TPA: hypothetical protein VFA94_12985 [Acidimicrobiales bacterium]|nr:hypothetical protein [Acidimicrobiales bacterium]